MFSPTPKHPSTTPSARGATLLWLLLALLPTGLKLAHLTRVAAWSWWKVTALLWVPWAVVAGLALAGWVLHWLGRRRG